MTLFVALLACQPPTAVGSTPLPPSPATPPTPPDAEVVIETAPGLRDLRAVAPDPLAAVAWFVDDAPADVEGTTVPARRLYPGETWRVEVTTEAGLTGSSSYTVPEPLGGNVLVLLLDDVGVDKVGAYGFASAGATPRLDALAEEGVRFTRAYASPVCSPTRGTLMTARMPRRTGLGWIADTGTRDIVLPLASTTIPEMLWESRASTTWSDAAIGKWHMAGPNAPDWLMHPNDSGFAWFSGPPGNPQYSPDRGYYSWTKNINGTTEESTVYMTTDSVDDALERIDTLPEPWFVYVAFNAAHGPLNLPPAELVSGPLPDTDAPPEVLYDAVLEALDTEIGRLFDTMDPDVYARTTILALGDNGTSDAGVPPEFDQGRNKHTPYEGGIRVPFIAAGPHVTEPGRTSDALVHIADVLPTVADLSGVPIGGADTEVLETLVPVTIDGRSLLPHLLDPDEIGREWVYAEAVGNGPPPYNIDRRAVQTATHKIVWFNQTEEFFRLAGPDQWDDVALAPEDMDDTDTAALLMLQELLYDAPTRYAYEGF